MESLPPELHEGEYVRCPTSGIIYRIVKTYKKRSFPTEELYTQMGAPVYKEVDCEILENIPDGPEYTLDEKDQVKEFVYEYPTGVEEGDTVYCKITGNRYLVANKTKRKFPNDELYKKYGSPPVKELPCDTIKSIPNGPPLTNDDVPTPTTPWYNTFMDGTFSNIFKPKEGFEINENKLKGSRPICLKKIANSFIKATFIALIGILFYTISNKPVNKEYISLAAAIVFIINILFN